MATMLLLLAALLLAVPGAFIAARGLSGLRRGFVIMRGREVGGGRGRFVALALLGYGIAMMAIAATLVLAAMG
jgi:hypothetical protein